MFHCAGGRPKVEARISVEELRAKFRKQMSLPGSTCSNEDTKIFDPMEKVPETVLPKSVFFLI